MAYADLFQQTVRGVMLQIPTAQQPGSAVFSSACYKHCVSQLSSFWGVKIGSQSLKSWLELWYFGVQNNPDAEAAAGADAGLPAGVSPRLVEPCVGFGACPAVARRRRRLLTPGLLSSRMHRLRAVPQHNRAQRLSDGGDELL